MTKQSEELKTEYKANFCWGQNDDLDELLYEFANCKTEEYRKEIYKSIREAFNTRTEKQGLDEELVFKVLCKEFDPTHIESRLRKSARDICQTFKPVVDEEEVSFLLLNLWMKNNHIGMNAEFFKTLGKAIADHLNEGRNYVL